MIQGTTPTHVFKLPIDTGTIRKLRVTYAQNGESIIEKTEDDAVMSGDVRPRALCQTTSPWPERLRPKTDSTRSLKATTDGIVVLIDLSGDTVTPETLPEGVTSHNAAGVPITGKLKIAHLYTGTNAPAATIGSDGDIYMQK